MAMSKISALLLVAALAFVVSSDARGAGYSRRLAQKAEATAAATSTGGTVSVESNAEATDNSTAISDVSGSSSGGSDVKVKGEAKATNGNTAKTEVDVEGREEAELDVSVSTEANKKTAGDVLARIEDAGDDRLAQIETVGELIRAGNGQALVIVIEDAFAIDDTTGVLVNDAISRAMNDIRSEGAAGQTAVAKTIVDATSVGVERARLFVFSVMNLVSIAGCDDLRSTLIEADEIATAGGKFEERAFIEAINTDEDIVQCLYKPCDDERQGCCNEESRAAGVCECTDADTCDYRLFWQIPRPIWACGFDNSDCEKPKCMCADAV